MLRTSEWRSVPPVAATRVGVAGSEPPSKRSKNDLKSPLKEAEKVGLTTMRPSAACTASTAARNEPVGKPTRRVDDGVGLVAQLDDGRPRIMAAVPQGTGRRRCQAVAQQASRGGHAQAATDHDQALLGHLATASTGSRASASSAAGTVAAWAASREAWVGASGTSAGLRAANSRRSTGTTSAPSRLELLEDGLQRQAGVVDQEELALVVAGVLPEPQGALDDLLGRAHGQRRVSA